MLIKSTDINSQKFEKVAFGYKIEDVDAFINEVAADYAQLEKDNDDISHKIQILADKVMEYRKDEDAVKDALLFAQKESHRIISEAKEKAEEILNNAKMESNKRAIEDIKAEQKAEEEKLDFIRNQVAEFKKSLFEMYKAHLEIISSMPQPDLQPVSLSPAKEVKEEVKNDDNKVHSGTLPTKETSSFAVPIKPLAAAPAKSQDNTAEEEKPDPFRTQSMPIIAEGKYSELQFGQQNNNK